MNQYTRWILISVMAMLCDVASAADWIRTNYTLRGVVPDNQVKNIAKDKNGFFWLLTTSGWAVRWNGSAFFSAHTVSRVISPDTRFWTCNADNNGDLVFWGRHPANQMYKVDKDSRLIKWTVADSLSIPYCPNRGLFFTIQKSIWRDIKSDTYDPSTNEGSFANCYWGNSVYPAGEDAYYVVAREKVYLLAKGLIRKVIAFDPDPAKEFAFGVDEYLVIRNTTGYKLYNNNGDLLYTHRDGSSRPAYKDMIVSTPIDGKCYGISGDIVYRWYISNNRLEQQEILRMEEDQKQLGFNSIYVDEERGRVLLAHGQGGISVYTRNSFEFDLTELPGEGSAVYSLAKKPGGVVTNRMVLQKFYGRKSIDYDYSGAVVPVDKGYAYLSSKDIAVFSNDHRLIHRRAFHGYGTLRFAVLLDERILFAVGGRFHIYDWVHNQLYTIDNSPLIASLPGVIRCIGDGGPATCFAVAENDVYKIDKKTLKIEWLFRLPIPNGDVRSIYFSQSVNALFFTLAGQGIYMFSFADKSYRKLPVEGAEELKSCHYVCQDKDGDFWMPTNFGLFLLFEKDLQRYLSGNAGAIQYYHFGKTDGLINEEFNGGFSNSGIAQGDSLFMANMRSVVSFKSTQVKQLVLPVPGERLVEVAIWKNDSLQEPGNTSVYVSAGFKNLIFQVDFPKPRVGAGTVEYRLKKSTDTSWRPLPMDNKVELRYLRSGKYRLEFRVNDIHSDQSLSYDITVGRYWYETWWAFTLYLALLTGLGILIFQWRIRSLRNKSLMEIDKSRRELFAIISHDLRSPLKAYQGLADLVSDLIREGKYDRIEKVAAQIDSTGAKLDLLLNNLLNWNLLQQDKLMIRHEQFNLSALL
ncbi:MAG: HAMP domain-containing histidine kinase, partial [Chitinophagaceae bacterium]|nr:HAMP domain-containing histidine kinase [Chitinophagaceae bacterium]